MTLEMEESSGLRPTASLRIKRHTFTVVRSSSMAWWRDCKPTSSNNGGQFQATVFDRLAGPCRSSYCAAMLSRAHSRTRMNPSHQAATNKCLAHSVKRGGPCLEVQAPGSALCRG